MSNVWYAAFGSNLLADRFLVYLRGGTIPLSGQTQPGARDATDPIEDRPYRLDHPMRFGFRSKRWDHGGVCFVDTAQPEPEATLGRAWLLTDDQLADVWAQENSQTVGPPIDVDEFTDRGYLDLDRGSFRRLAHIGHLDGLPVATITCAAAPDPNPAALAYLTIVGRGLMETWGLSADDTADYLVARNAAARLGPAKVDIVSALLAS